MFYLQQICIFLHSTIAFACVKLKVDIQRSDTISLLKFIFSLITLKDLCNDELKEAEQDMLIDYLEYFDQMILNNDYNVNLIYTNVYILFLSKFFVKQSYSIPLQLKLQDKLFRLYLKYIRKIRLYMKVFLSNLQCFFD